MSDLLALRRWQIQRIMDTKHVNREEAERILSFREKEAAQKRQNEAQRSMLEFKNKQVEWLKDLDSRDSKPNDGRVDISVFNDKVAKYGWQPVSTTATVVGKHGKSKVEMNSVDIEEQAEAMTKQHFNIES